MTFEIEAIGSIQRAETGIFLLVSEPYREALRGVESHSHIVVFWWALGNDSPETRQTLLVHPRPLPEVEMGVFATRSPRRPNPIMCTTCRVISVDLDAGKVHIQNIDAFDQTPIIDIKSYAPTIDRVKEGFKAPWPQENFWIPDEGVGLH